VQRIAAQWNLREGTLRARRVLALKFCMLGAFMSTKVGAIDTASENIVKSSRMETAPAHKSVQARMDGSGIGSKLELESTPTSTSLVDVLHTK